MDSLATTKLQAKGRSKVTTSVRDKLGKGRERISKFAPRSGPNKSRPVKTAN